MTIVYLKYYVHLKSDLCHSNVKKRQFKLAIDRNLIRL